jgi:hypothetical protein
LIGTSFPPKLQTAAHSYHSAASIYKAYAQALTEAQNQLDQAMDQAMPVAALANSTVPPAPPNASAAQVAAVQQQQQSVDQANDQLTAAKRLAQDAQDMRNQAGGSFNSNLNDVSAIPDESFWQKLLDFFEHNPVFQIFIDIAIAIVSIFFPVVGLVLGAVLFGLTTTLNYFATGHVDWGNFATGLLTLALGAGVASGVFKALGTAAGGLFKTVSGAIAKGIQNDASLLGKVAKVANTTAGKVGLSTVGNFAYNASTNAASNAIDHQQVDPKALLVGAAAGAVVAGASAGVESKIFGGGSAGVHTPSAAQAPHDPDPTATPPPAGSAPAAGATAQAPATASGGAGGSQSPATADPGQGSTVAQTPGAGATPPPAGAAAQTPGAGTPPAPGGASVQTSGAGATPAPGGAAGGAAVQTSGAGATPAPGGAAVHSSGAGTPPASGGAAVQPSGAGATPAPGGAAVQPSGAAATPAPGATPAPSATSGAHGAEPANNPLENAFGQASQAAQSVASSGTSIAIGNADGDDNGTTADQEVQAAQAAGTSLAVGKYNPPFT